MEVNNKDEKCLSNTDLNKIAEKVAKILSKNGIQTVIQEDILKYLGLNDDKAPIDIRSLREFLVAMKIAKRTFIQTVIRWFTIAILIAIIIGLATEFNLFNQGN